MRNNKNNKEVEIYLSNTLSGKKQLFVPIDTSNIRMYACGPTVYDRPHLGNARAAVVYDTLYRLLKYVYPKVTYSRNITDVDDKIINAAKKSKESIRAIAEKYTKFYHNDINALGCLSPDYEPKATEYIKEMISMIESLLNKGYAYISKGHVLFEISKYKDYGSLSNKTLDELIAGARVEVESYKKNPGDFVLWKPVVVNPKNDKGFDNEGFASPWGLGRPGWHIECSAMSKTLLGDIFDIHGGGADLKFPHHENEIAQSCAANGTTVMANYWIHNGFLTVEGEKMSKSLNNFTTVRDVLDQGIDGNVIRLFYLTTHYKKPIDFSEKALSDAKKAYDKFIHCTAEYLKVIFDNPRKPEREEDQKLLEGSGNTDLQALQYLADDLNTPKVLALAHEVASKGNGRRLISIMQMLGFNILKEARFYLDQKKMSSINSAIPKDVIALANERVDAKKNKQWDEADALRRRISEMGYQIKDLPSNEYELFKK